MTVPLTFEQFTEQYCSLQGDKWNTVDDLRSDFQKLHGINLDDHVRRIQETEYALYLQRIAAHLDNQ